jgi:hypothetical protein
MESPYMIFDSPNERREKALNCELAYIKYWVEMVKKAEPVQDAKHREYADRRKKIIQQQLRKRDPLGSVLVRTLGPDAGKKAILGYT